MSDADDTVVAGIVVPSDDPVFLTIVAVHVVLALVCVVTGFGAILSAKGSRRHRMLGTTYYAFLMAVFVSASVLSILRWSQDSHLFGLGLLSFAAATYGRTVQRGNA